MARSPTVILVLTALAAGCGDRCEVLCQQTANRIAACKPDSLSWPDLGARSRVRFRDQCRDDWYRTSTGMTANDLRIALEVCDDTQADLAALSCEEVIALYAGQE